MLRNLATPDITLSSLYIRSKATGFDLKGLKEDTLDTKLESIKTQIESLRINSGSRLIIIKDPEPYDFTEDRMERIVIALKYAAIYSTLGQLKCFVTIDPGVTQSYKEKEARDEEHLMKIDEEQMAKAEEEKPEEFDKVAEEQPQEEGADGAEAVAVVKIVTKRLPRTAKPVGDVMCEIMQKDIGQENVLIMQE